MMMGMCPNFILLGKKPIDGGFLYDVASHMGCVSKV